MNKNKLIMILAILSTCSIYSAQKLGAGLMLKPIADEVESQNKPSFWQKFAFWSKPAKNDIYCLGPKLASSFLTAKLDSPTAFWSNRNFSIPEVSNTLDIFICQKIVAQKAKGLDLDHLSSAEFAALNDMKRQYFDALPKILENNFSKKNVALYVAAITQARHDFEAKHNGALLELD